MSLPSAAYGPRGRSFQPSPPLIDAPSGTMVNFKTIRRIMCSSYTGTGVVIGEGTMITAAHVIQPTDICVDQESGQIGVVVYKDFSADVATVKFSKKLFSEKMEISCKGFKKGGRYFAIGYEHGESLVINRMVGSGVTEQVLTVEGGNYPQMSMLFGRIIPGMSGGPIVDDKGRMVGMNNATDSQMRGWSRSMRDTKYCAKD